MFTNESPVFSGGITLKGGYARKINNLVKGHIFAEFTASAGVAGSFDIINLPINKTSNFNFAGNDIAGGVCSGSIGANNVLGNVSSIDGTKNITVSFSTFLNAVTYQLNIYFDYTTD